MKEIIVKIKQSIHSAPKSFPRKDFREVMKQIRLGARKSYVDRVEESVLVGREKPKNQWNEVKTER